MPLQSADLRSLPGLKTTVIPTERPPFNVIPTERSDEGSQNRSLASLDMTEF